MGRDVVQDIYELSPLQRAMLLRSVYDGASDMYLDQHVYTIEGPLDPDLLEQAWGMVYSAHSALRTSFHWEGLDRPLQIVHREVSPPTHRHDWSGVGEDEQRERLQRLLADDQDEGFDLTEPPLQRLHLIRLGPHQHGLAWSHHHLLLDDWSVPIFMNDAMAHYEVLRTDGGSVAPSPPAPPFRDYIAWLRSQDVAAAEIFWADTFDRFRPVPLVPLRPVNAGRSTGAVDRYTVPLPVDLEQGLRAAAARHQVALAVLFQAVWAVMLRRLTGSSAVSFGAVTSGRPSELAGVDKMIGLFANTLPVPVTVPGDGDLGTWLRELQDRCAAIRRFEFSPLADIEKWAGALGGQLFDSFVVLADHSVAVEVVDRSLTVRSHAVYDRVSVPLSLIVNPQVVSEVQLLVHRNRFDPDFPDEAMSCVRRTLEAIATADSVEPVLTAAGPQLTSTAAAVEIRAAEGPSIPPETPEEEAIAAVFRDVLGIDQVDVTSSFFDLGGDSFGALRAVGRIDGATVAMLAAYPSVRELADALAAVGESDDDLDVEIAELEHQIAEHADLERQLADKRAAKETRP